MSALAWRQLSIAAISAVATIVVVVVAILAGGSIGSPGPVDEPVLPAFETVSNDTPTEVSETSPQEPVVRDRESIQTPSNCAVYGGVDGLPILDPHRCVASDHIPTVE